MTTLLERRRVAALVALALLGSVLAIASNLSFATAGGCIQYDIQYTNGAVDAGEWCDGNEVTRADVPGLNALVLHISCSDDLTAPEKSDLDGLVVDTYTIIKDSKTCTEVDPSGDAKCYAYDIRYTNGAVDEGLWCDGNEITRDDDPGLNALVLHLSCSDDLKNPDKSDLDGLVVDTYTIVKPDGKTCSDVDPSGDAKCITYDFRYTNGARDAGVWCDGNTVTRTDVPDLNALELHISCSDDFSDPANPEKSDFDGLVLETYYIVKHDGKTCGEEPPAEEQTITFDCGKVTISGNVPVENSTVVYTDGTSQYVWGAGRTDFMVTAPDGKVIAAIYLDGVRTNSDVDPATCHEPFIEVTVGCYYVEINSSDPIQRSTIVFEDGSMRFVPGEGRTSYTVTSTKLIVAMWVDGVRYDAPADRICT